MKVGIIDGSVREGRKSTTVAEWVKQNADSHGGAEFEIVSLAEFNIPILTSATVPGAANRQYDTPEVQKWSEAIDSFDAFIFVTPEYNHGVPGALKNAFDSIGPEWQNKPAAIVSYGADNGVRAVEQWRQILANFNMHVVRAQVSLSLFTEFSETGVSPEERRAGEINGLLDQLIAAGK